MKTGWAEGKRTYTHHYLALMADYVPILKAIDYKELFDRETYERTQIWLGDEMSRASESTYAKVIGIYVPLSVDEVLNTVEEINKNYPDLPEGSKLAHGAHFRQKCHQYFEGLG